ncbi:MAG: PEP-CTERM sorting domain-containing protein [Opitutaceae bacterium]
MTRSTRYLLSILGLFLALSSATNAEVLWSSTLNGSDFNWVVDGGVDTGYTGSSAPNNSYAWELSGGEAVYHNAFSTQDYEDITLEYSFSVNTTGIDRLRVYYAIDGSTNWLQLTSHTDGIKNVGATFNLPVTADENIGGVSIRFAVDGSAPDQAYISDVSLSGTPVPEPATYALLFGLIVGVTVLQRRKGITQRHPT